MTINLSHQIKLSHEDLPPFPCFPKAFSFFSFPLSENFTAAEIKNEHSIRAQLLASLTSPEGALVRVFCWDCWDGSLLLPTFGTAKQAQGKHPSISFSLGRRRCAARACVRVCVGMYIFVSPCMCFFACMYICVYVFLLGYVYLCLSVYMCFACVYISASLCVCFSVCMYFCVPLSELYLFI